MIHVIAAGNTNSDNDLTAYYPANYPIHNKLVAAASDHNDNMASFSSYGEKSVHLAAPGVAIWSTVAGGGYSSFSGTSMATPHVSGAAALIWSNNPSLSYDSVQNVILCNVDPISVPKKTITNGRLNIGTAVGNDSVDPSQITNLSATQLGYSTITISFDATGDDISSGNACYYDVRYSTSPITDDSTWNDATRASGEPKPQTPGSSEGFEISGLEPATTYYIGVKVGDEVGNESVLSNIVTAITESGIIVFEDDMEGVVGPWDPGLNTLWHTSEHNSHSLDRAWYYGQEVIWNYDTGVANNGILKTGLLDLTDAQEASLTFWEWSALEASTSYDRTRVMVSIDGVIWITEFESHGTNGLWEERVVDLNSYVGNQVIIGFDFDTIDNLYNNYEGWYIDDVKVEKFVPSNPTTNQPPNANAGPDQTVTDSDNNGSESVTLDGSGSRDDSTIVSWDWSESGSPIGSGETFDTSFSVGTHTVTLMVTDDDVATDTDTVVITVNANQPPTADAGADQTVTDSDNNGSESVTLDGSASSDSDGLIVSYEWKDETDTVIGITASINPTVPLGAHVYTLTVTDDGGATDTDTVSVTVEAPSAASASIIKPGELEQVSGKTKIEWVLSGFTGQTTVEVYIDGTLKTTITSGKVSYMWNTGNDGMGPHIILIEVTDTNNNSDNDSKNVEVVPKGGGSDPGNCPPGKTKKNLC